jgi:nondiscriminating aspartyl-tRNA synthetase
VFEVNTMASVVGCPRVWSVELADHVGERVAVAGWLHRLRRLSSVTFLILRDGRGLAQIVVPDPALVDRLAALEAESVLYVEGEVIAAPQAPRGIELIAEQVEVIAPATAPLPFELHRPRIPAQLPTVLDHAAVGLRHPRQRALFRLAAASVEGFRRVLRAEHFVEVFTPKLVATATESGANVFPVDYFGQTVFLAQSPQLYKQMLVGVFERVFEVGPAFRAEPHDTPRHLNEFVSLDVEVGFIRDHTTVMALVERVLRGMLAEVADGLGELGYAVPSLPASIPRIDFVAAQQLVQAATGEAIIGEPDLAPGHERWLGDWAQREHGSAFLFVVGYPLAKRPFYTHPDPARPWLSNSFDLLFRGVELMTGGQRLHRYADYLQALAGRALDPAPLEGYLEAFRHGMPPHGGFALGLERWVARLVDAANVRETTLFPRDLHRLTP